MKLRLTCLLFLAVGLSNCEKPVDTSEIPGRYVSNFGGVTDVLILRPDGQFLHIIGSDGSAKKENLGTWSSVDKRRILLTNFVWQQGTPGDRLRKAQSEISEEAVSVSIEFGFSQGKVRLTVNSDLGYYYIKE